MYLAKAILLKLRPRTKVRLRVAAYGRMARVGLDDVALVDEGDASGLPRSSPKLACYKDKPLAGPAEKRLRSKDEGATKSEYEPKVRAEVSYFNRLCLVGTNDHGARSIKVKEGGKEGQLGASPGPIDKTIYQSTN